jgi:hypothetical protein
MNIQNRDVTDWRAAGASRAANAVSEISEEIRADAKKTYQNHLEWLTLKKLNSNE